MCDGAWRDFKEGGLDFLHRNSETEMWLHDGRQKLRTNILMCGPVRQEQHSTNKNMGFSLVYGSEAPKPIM